MFTRRQFFAVQQMGYFTESIIYTRHGLWKS
jgi:hypothetical protein